MFPSPRFHRLPSPMRAAERRAEPKRDVLSLNQLSAVTGAAARAMTDGCDQDAGCNKQYVSRMKPDSSFMRDGNMYSTSRFWMNGPFASVREQVAVCRGSSILTGSEKKEITRWLSLVLLMISPPADRAF